MLTCEVKCCKLKVLLDRNALTIGDSRFADKMFSPRLGSTTARFDRDLRLRRTLLHNIVKY